MVLSDIASLGFVEWRVPGDHDERRFALEKLRDYRPMDQGADECDFEETT